MSRLIDIYIGKEVRRLDEASLPLRIGSEETAHIRLNSGHGLAAYVGDSRQHLFMQPAEDNLAIYHNDQRISHSVWLKSGDTTRIGEDLIQWNLSGQRLEVHVSKVSAVTLQPPTEAPDEPKQKSQEIAIKDEAPPVLAPPQQSGRNLRPIAIVVFLLLLASAAFVLLAKPLTITVTPSPDSIKISGFPPVIQFGDHHLGILGGYTVHAEKEGYQPLTEEVEINTQGSSYSFTMALLPGLIDVISEPAGATLLVNGTAVGTTPLQELKIAAGTNMLRFELERYLPIEQEVETAGRGERLNFQIKLEPAWAIYTLQTNPPGATVTVDGVEQGETPLEVELIAGTRELIFNRELFTPLTVTLDVEAGQDTTPAVFELEPAPAILTITSQPDGATVTADGSYLGLTPLTTSLKAMVAHEVRVATAGYLPTTRKLTLGPEEERSLNFKLEPQYGTIFIDATPPDATLAIDGKVQKQAIGRFRLTTRAHILELKAAGYESLSKKITPQAGYSQKVELDLPRKGQSTKAATNTTSDPGTKSGLEQKMVLIKPQPFVMGASRNEAGRRANESEHKVTLQRSFYIAKQEVTNAEYRQFQSQHSSGMSGNRSLDIDSHPVSNVSWNDAARFLNWLSKREGLPPFYHEVNGTMVAAKDRNIGYRLPTEAEWAYTARVAGRKERARYPWEGKYPPQIKAGNFADESARPLLPVVIKGYNDGFAATAPVASFPVDSAGVHDLGGNVAEWCHDYYAANNGKGGVDPMGPATGTHHVIRGSSWRDASITELRFSYRRYSKESANDVGFRIARYAQ